MLTILLTVLSLGTAEGGDNVRITHAHLIATCVAGTPVTAKIRSWQASTPQSLTFTMRNEPRAGIDNRPAGIAVIDFTPEAGHRYEIEVRAAGDTFSRRVWPRGEWKPVVRDRTTDTIVSSEPRWIENGCR